MLQALSLEKVEKESMSLDDVPGVCNLKGGSWEPLTQGAALGSEHPVANNM